MESLQNRQPPTEIMRRAACAVTPARGRDEVRQQQHREAIRCWIDSIRGNPRPESIRLAVENIMAMLVEEFPCDRYQRVMAEGLLEAQLRRGLAEKSAVVTAMVTRENHGAVWSWTTHLVEISGIGAQFDEMIATFRSSDSGTWRTRTHLEDGLRLEPFGWVSHTWSCLNGPWQGASVSLSYHGYSDGKSPSMLVVRSPEQYSE